MKVFYTHLLRFFDDKPSIEDVSDKLFQLGHENTINDNVLDIDITPNRGDCLSLLGLSRDLGVFYRLKKNPFEIYEDKLDPFEINFTNHSKEDCPTISFLHIEIDNTTNDYKPYLESYFKDNEIKKINFFTDISNYLAYELGQPTHCYDYKKLGNSLNFINKELDEEFITLTNKKIHLTGNNCIFSSDKKIISLAGIMGGISTACSESTRIALIESAFFKPESILGKSVKYDLHSDSSYKFERGIDPLFQVVAIRRFIKIVSEHTNIINMRLFTQDNKNFNQIHLTFDSKRISSILGFEIKENEYMEILIKLGFKISNNIVLVPSYRSDISTQNDLAEEVARSIGYNNINPKDFYISKTHNISKNSKEKAIAEFLIDSGFNETINMPFTSNFIKSSIKIDNPIDSNKNYLRTNINDSLIANLLFNENRQHDSIKLFEISEIYSKSKDINKNKKIGLIISGRVGHNYINFSKKLNRSFLCELFKSIDIDLLPDDIKEVSRNDLKIKSKIKNDIYFIELDIEDLPESIINYSQKKNPVKPFQTKYCKTSEFPSSVRDLSFIIQDSSLIKDLENILLNYQSNNIKDVFVFDFYENPKNNNIKIGFRFIFQSIKHTLALEDIDTEMSEIINKISHLKGVEIPGLYK